MNRGAGEGVGLDVKWSWNSFSAKIKSRTISVLDRLGAAKVEPAFRHLERQNKVSQAVTDAELALIAASTSALKKEIQMDPQLARQMLISASRAARQSANVDACVSFALEDLVSRDDRGTNDDGPDQVAEPFLDRWEMYAVGASTEELRAKWGKILASEVRTPGMFSMKALRVMDEIEPSVAMLFERFCAARLANWVPFIATDLNEAEIDALTEAELVKSMVLPATVTFAETTKHDGTAWWLLGTEEVGIVIRKDADLRIERNRIISAEPLHMRDGRLLMNVYGLTRTGEAIASIITYDERAAVDRLAAALETRAEAGAVKVVVRSGEAFIDMPELKPPVVEEH